MIFSLIDVTNQIQKKKLIFFPKSFIFL